MVRLDYLSIAFSVILLIRPIIVLATCPQSPIGYYQPPSPGGTFVSGLPPVNWFTYQKISGSLSCSELAQLHLLCVARINMYRSGQLVFSNGSSDPTLGSPSPLQYASGMDQCHSEITMGDFALMGTCASAAHQNAWNCEGFDVVWGQNLCCPRQITSTNTFQSVVTAMNGCLQSMWDEGMHPTTGTTGHWENMKDPTFLYASCGFAFGTQNSNSYVLMTQNFGGAYKGATTPLTTSAPTPPTLSVSPTYATNAPTSKAPTRAPTYAPTSKAPTLAPTMAPTTKSPTLTPTSKTPTTVGPTTKTPTPAPSSPTSKAPTRTPTRTPTAKPSTLVPTSETTSTPTTKRFAATTSNASSSVAWTWSLTVTVCLLLAML